MMSMINIITNTEEYLLSLGVITPLFSCIMIFLDSFISIFPYFILISINILILNPILGFLLSFLSTILGSYIMYLLVKNKLKDFTNFHLKNNKIFKRITTQIKEIKLSTLIIVYALPYTPTFIVNIAIALTNVKEKLFIKGLFFGKIINVLFWTFLSLGLFDNIKNVNKIITFVTILFTTYISSKIYIKNFTMKERNENE